MPLYISIYTGTSVCIPSRHKARRYKERGSSKFPALCKTIVPPSKFFKARKCLIASFTTQYFVKHSTKSLKWIIIQIILGFLQQNG